MKQEFKKFTIGERRKRSGFLWLPKKLDNLALTKEVFRWLEHAEWQEEYTYFTHSPVGWYADRWLDI
jgi:hypothetical protein